MPSRYSRGRGQELGVRRYHRPGGNLGKVIREHGQKKHSENVPARSQERRPCAQVVQLCCTLPRCTAAAPLHAKKARASRLLVRRSSRLAVPLPVAAALAASESAVRTLRVIRLRHCHCQCGTGSGLSASASAVVQWQPRQPGHDGRPASLMSGSDSRNA